MYGALMFITRHSGRTASRPEGDGHRHGHPCGHPRGPGRGHGRTDTGGHRQGPADTGGHKKAGPGRKNRARPRPHTMRPSAGTPHSSPSHICSSTTDHQLSGELSAAGSKDANCAWKSTVQRPACSWVSP